jgi:uncharacterized membrane protein HdeD (DUF308 family)
MITVFLGTILGWYFLIMGLFLIIRRDVVISAMKNVVDQPGLLLVIAFITLIIGLMMIATHNVWVWDWPVIITLIGWFALIRGIIRLFYPEFVHRMWNKMSAHPIRFTISGIIMLILGLFLSCRAYLMQ